MMDGIKVIASVCLNQLYKTAAERRDKLQEESSQYSLLSLCVCDTHPNDIFLEIIFPIHFTSLLSLH